MMPLFWVVLWSTLPPLALSCGPDCCTVHESSSLQNVSPLLNSLQCHNDYESYVYCKWREHGNIRLQLWFKTENNREQCMPHGAEVQDASEHRIVQCRYKTRAFSIGIKHTVFFLKNKTHSLCSSVPHKPLDLSQHLTARPPVNLSTYDGGDGGRQLGWSSPYASSSSLNKNLTYQLSFKTDREDTWTSEDVRNTSMTLEKPLLLPGRRYEARVRARASVGQWSDWSPVVTWHTEEDTGKFPSLHCVLEEEEVVMCSWEVSTEVDLFVIYQLACRPNQTAPSKICCGNPKVSPDLSRAVMRYSCSLTAAEHSHLLLELLPARNAKSFNADQHICPKPPHQVKVRKKDSNWLVEWTNPNRASEIRLYYQVCYYRTQDQGSTVLLNISEGSMSLSILDSSLVPSQRYQVRVRSLIVPTHYKGIPSKWTDPVEWTSHEATWSVTTLIYFIIGMFVATVFLTLYRTIPACQRRAVLWVDSVPSPGKSKIMSEVKSGTKGTPMQNESTTICRVLHLDKVSTCTSDAWLWPTKDTETNCLEQDEGCWKCDSLLCLAEKVRASDTSSMSFSGPYIFCQSSGPSCKSADVRCEDKKKEQESPSDDSASPSPVNFSLYGEGYVCLPSRSVSRSTQDLISHSDGNTNTHRHDSAERDQQCHDKKDGPPGLSEPASSHPPPAYISGPFTPWPQGSIAQPSGYCHLPAAFMSASQ
ncbi:cytokine receptor common subunit beta isoform X1 [Etheostoma spectabile]|uniref:cytokine receptor common subunit beta isoform X1 n=1 Tax=Etheostoma spectabile TaxID=54343 RepID=UPI0013AF04D2|nr:cytokine receptor common subunit beta isoform X1 [Etheostoma spectabile]XP_032393925.1 cytokine receptor common subunit beta isoform X1 [Etheostoma spectabile]XP_032393926.1 cytokine receptor common subunit beta isoform X1 [Etheostoma spectabile]